MLRGGDFPEGGGATAGGDKTVGASGGLRDVAVEVGVEGAVRSEDELGSGGGEEETGVGERGGGRDGGMKERGRRVVAGGGRGGGRDGGCWADLDAGGGGLGRDGRLGGRKGGEVGESAGESRISV